MQRNSINSDNKRYHSIFDGVSTGERTSALNFMPKDTSHSPSKQQKNNISYNNGKMVLNLNSKEIASIVKAGGSPRG